MNACILVPASRHAPLDTESFVRATGRQQKAQDAEMDDTNGPTNGPVTVTDSQLVTPGEVLTMVDNRLTHGHCTRIIPAYELSSISPDVLTEQQATPELLSRYIRSTVAGTVSRINSLLTVVPSRLPRYRGHTGDVVVGRIIAVGPGPRWRIDLNARCFGVMRLSSILLPDGVQRRKSQDDELQMRTYFKEGDLFSAEVQSIGHDSMISVHFRNNKFGKLSHGTLITVPPHLVLRSIQFTSIPSVPGSEHNSGAVDVILSLNGYIWVAPKPMEAGDSDFSPAHRLAAARVCAAIRALASHERMISNQSILMVCEASASYSPASLSRPEIAAKVIAEAIR
ncbi:hypothetical protein H696_00669 [Fonticula alba]|uniref:Ribosomal RNA-processing protein 4 n=1 Tax=Fonticula alba TaxID=691883 RepID=A0A058ZGR3_FONAL|nr:hypothetical protein H696_00669 [Fonticula alba]KCV73123.1 hypothetical protein H696_00669 [Fonticula alba]|eukprot:XP_009492824.1 hypothetical protein H696_00669 [Fonticula alba]